MGKSKQVKEQTAEQQVQPQVQPQVQIGQVGDYKPLPKFKSGCPNC